METRNKAPDQVYRDLAAELRALASRTEDQSRLKTLIDAAEGYERWAEGYVAQARPVSRPSLKIVR